MSKDVLQWLHLAMLVNFLYFPLHLHNYECVRRDVNVESIFIHGTRRAQHSSTIQWIILESCLIEFNFLSSRYLHNNNLFYANLCSIIIISICNPLSSVVKVERQHTISSNVAQKKGWKDIIWKFYDTFC